MAVPQGRYCSTSDEVAAAYDELETELCVVKAQIHAGGRGKAGGVKLVRSTAEAKEAAEVLRRESAAAPGRHVAALVLFGRAARGALSLAAEEMAKKFSEPAGRAISGSDVVVDGLVSLADAKCHVGDAAEWLAAGSRAAALVAMDAAHRRALAGELQECRAALEKTRA